MRHWSTRLVILLTLICAITIKVNAQDNYFSPKHIRTSYSNDNYIDLTIKDSSLEIEGRLDINNLKTVCIKIGNYSEYIETMKLNKFRASLNINNISPNEKLYIYTGLYDDELLWTILNGDIYLHKEKNGDYKFMESTVVDNNKYIDSVWINPCDYMEDKPELIQLTDYITRGATSKYDKAYELYKWVSKNIYYDLDFYEEKTSSTYDTPNDVLTYRKCVCTGYVHLLIALLQSQEIPAYEVIVELPKYDNFIIDDCVESEYKHSILEAWIDGRWVIMDPTSNSKNTVKDGEYIKEETNGSLLFDPTLEFLSYYYNIESRANRN